MSVVVMRCISQLHFLETDAELLTRAGVTLAKATHPVMANEGVLKLVLHIYVSAATRPGLTEVDNEFLPLPITGLDKQLRCGAIHSPGDC